MKKLAIIFAIFVFLSLSAAAYVYWDLMRFGKYPSHPDRSVTAVVTITPGQGFKSIATHLNRQGIIQKPLRFRLYARVRKMDGKIKAGEYLLSSDMTPDKILDHLVTGKVILYKVTIPEGYSLNQIADLLEQEGLAERQSFIAAAHDADRISELNLHADSLEGYLFPDTYHFPRNLSVDKMVAVMVKRFHSQWKPEWKKRAEELGLSIHEIVTLASIIEKETGEPSERPVISSVFHNRLKQKMRLDSDPTVIYGIEDFDGNLTRAHLNTHTPYNTYRIKGLPPGPIANPGAAALESALYPADTSYLFFVSKQNGTHQFSTTISEHNQAVRKYQSKR